MKVTILGSGSSQANAKRGPAGYVVQEGDTQVVLDAGSGTLGRACRAGIEPGRTDAVVVTHLHPDHVSDVVPLLFEIKHRNPGRRDDLPLFGPPHFSEAFDCLMNVFGSWCVGETYELRPTDVQDDAFRIGPIEVHPFPVVHGQPTNGYRFVGSSGAAFAFTADTSLHDAVVEGVRGASLLVADCTVAAPTVIEGHMNAEQAGELAQRAGVQRLILSHLSAETEGVDLIGQAARHFDGAVQRAEDLVAFDL